MVGWHHQLNGHEQALGVGDGQGSLACCSPWGHKELDMTEWLNRTRWCCRSSWDRLTSASSASVAEAQTSITVMLNGLPWKRTKITLSFLRLHSNTTFLNSFVDYEGYSISSKGFLPTIVDIMVIWIKFTHFLSFFTSLSLNPQMSVFNLAISCINLDSQN